MKRLYLAVALGLGLCTVAAVAPQQKDKVIRARVDVVNVLCTVRDQNGKGDYVSNLTKEDFELAENGKPQNIQYFSHGSGEAADPLSVVLLIDTSGSVKNKLGFEQRAAIEFLTTTLRQNKDLAAIVHFHDSVELLQDFTYDHDLLSKAIRETRAGGGTKLYDAIFVAAEDMLKKEVGRRVMVVLSDGNDTMSELPKKDAVKAAQDEDIVIFGIGVEDQDTNFGALKSFASETGGLFVDSDVSLEKLRQAFGKINGEIKNQYSLGYVSTNPGKDGAFREIQVKIKKRGLKVKHRKGYYAPQDDEAKRS